MENNSCTNECDDIPSSEYVYVVLTAVTSGLSIFGGTCICVLYFAFKDIRSPARQLLLFLAFSDAMLALGNLLGIIWFLYSDSSIINKSDAYCDFQSAMTIYFSMTSFAWTVTMGISLFATVVLNKQSFTVTYMKLFHILAWIPAGVITIIALSMNVLGTNTSLKQASWCWIDPRVPNALLWQFVTGKFFEIVSYITTVVLYTSIKVFLLRQAKKNIGRVRSKRSRRDVIAEANRKLTFVPLVFIVCRIWGTLRFLIGNFGQDIVGEPYVTWINPLQGIGDSAQGFANFVIYCFSTRSIRRRMCPFANKIGVATSFVSETKTGNTLANTTKKNAVGPSEMKGELASASTGLGNSTIFQIKNTKTSKYKSSPEEKLTTDTKVNKTEQLSHGKPFSFEIAPENTTSVESSRSNIGKDTGDVKSLCLDEKCEISPETKADVTLNYTKNCVTFQVNDKNDDTSESEIISNSENL